MWAGGAGGREDQEQQLLPPHHLLLRHPVFWDGLDQPDPPHLQSLLQEADLLLLLLAVVLDVLPQAAGIGVPLQTTDHLALVRLLNTVGQHLTTL